MTTPLPLDVLATIMCELPLPSVVACAGVCRLWRAASATALAQVRSASLTAPTPVHLHALAAHCPNVRKLEIERAADVPPHALLPWRDSLTHVLVVQCSVASLEFCCRKELSLQSLSVVGGRVHSLSALGCSATLEVLSLHKVTFMTTLNALASLKRLRQLVVSACPELRNVSAVGLLGSLRVLSVVACRNVPDLCCVDACVELESLTARACLNLRAVGTCGTLRRLGALDLGNSRLRPANVRELFAHWEDGQRCALRRLNIDSTAVLSMLHEGTPLALPASLTSLAVSRCHDAPALRSVGVRLGGLQSLVASNCGSVVHLGQLGECIGPRLRFLNVTSCENLRDVSALTQCPHLTRLHLGATAVRDLEPLAGLCALTVLHIPYCVQVRDLGPLARLAGSLRVVRAGGCSAVGAQLGPLECLHNATLIEVSLPARLELVAFAEAAGKHGEAQCVLAAPLCFWRFRGNAARTLARIRARALANAD